MVHNRHVHEDNQHITTTTTYQVPATWDRRLIHQSISWIFSRPIPKVIFSAVTIFPQQFETEGKWLFGKEPKCQLVLYTTEEISFQRCNDHIIRQSSITSPIVSYKRKIDLNSSGTNDCTELYVPPDTHTKKNNTSINSKEKKIWNNTKIKGSEYAPFVSRRSCCRGRGCPLIPFFVLLASSPDLTQIPCCSHACCCSTLVPISFTGCPSTATPPFPIIVAQNFS